MSTAYLFRIDGAKDNDEFFGALRSSVAHAYAGVDFRVGKTGWIPDLVKVVVEEPPDRCALTLIELEATESVALLSCRKYLPEDSGAIMVAFNDYLDRVIRQCRSSADPRETVFGRLKSVLSDATEVTITTAGALRSAAGFVEEHRLIDQPRLIAKTTCIAEVQPETTRVFRGVLRLNAYDAKALSRCMMILDAVIRHKDHSDATHHAWRGRDALKRLLNEKGGSYPALRAFVFETKNHGVTLDFEKVLGEIVEIWPATRGAQIDPEKTRNLVCSYFPIALAIQGHNQMTGVFETARKYVDEDFRST
jgi:hypothetical protein